MQPGKSPYVKAFKGPMVGSRAYPEGGVFEVLGDGKVLVTKNHDALRALAHEGACVFVGSEIDPDAKEETMPGDLRTNIVKAIPKDLDVEVAQHRHALSVLNGEPLPRIINRSAAAVYQTVPANDVRLITEAIKEAAVAVGPKDIERTKLSTCKCYK